MPAAGTPAAAAPSDQAREPETEAGWWSRLFGARNGRPPTVSASGRFIRIEVRQLDKTVNIDCPSKAPINARTGCGI